MSFAPRQIQKLVAEVDENELVIRIIEAMGGVRRPVGKTNADILAHTPADTLSGARDTARAVMGYVAECFSNAARPQ